MQQQPQNHQSGFTLLELMVVIGIMVIMFSLAIPAFQDIGQSSKMNTALDNLRTTLSLARQHAIMNRENVFVVFPSDDPNLYSVFPEHAEKGCRAYAVYSEGGGYIGGWRYLPEGIVFSPDVFHPGSGTKNTKNVLNHYQNRTIVSARFPTSTNNFENIHAIEFTPVGKLKATSVTGGLDLYLTEGWTTPDTVAGTVTVNYTPTEFQTNKTVRGFNVSINTGQLKVREYLTQAYDQDAIEL